MMSEGLTFGVSFTLKNIVVTRNWRCFENLPSLIEKLCMNTFCYVVTGIDWGLKCVFKV